MPNEVSAARDHMEANAKVCTLMPSTNTLPDAASQCYNASPHRRSTRYTERVWTTVTTDVHP
ncbi:hypothetical protein C2E31_25220 [Rhodopirellula baltica]|nr:hypothetical protein C2E31_25220 [Rhodopirellula baltica]